MGGDVEEIKSRGLKRGVNGKEEDKKVFKRISVGENYQQNFCN